MDQPTAEKALKELEPLIGDWTLEAIPPGGEPWPGGARATFEWHDSEVIRGRAMPSQTTGGNNCFPATTGPPPVHARNPLSAELEHITARVLAKTLQAPPVAESLLPREGGIRPDFERWYALKNW